MGRATTVATLALLAACVAGCSSSKAVYTSTGAVGHTVSCNPVWRGGLVGQLADASTSWNQCYERAGEICGAAGYDILDRTGETGSYGQAGQYGGFVSTTNNRSMVIKCKGT